MSSADPEKPASASDTPSMIPATVPAFDRHYSDDQRETVIYARIDREQPFRAIHELARAGELKTSDGRTLEPFEMPETTMRSLARRALDKRAGRVSNAIADLPHRDAIEQLRRRAVTLAHYRLEEEEKRKGSTDPEMLRQIMRVILEASRLPAATDPSPPSHATRDATGKKSSASPGGLAGALLKDHRAQETPEQNAPTQQGEDRGEHGDNGALPPQQAESETDALPGAQPSTQAHAVLG